MIGLAAGLTGARAGTPRRLSPTSPKRTSPTPTGSATRRPSRRWLVTAGARTEVSSRRLLLLRAARPGSAGVRTGLRADLGCAACRDAVDAGIATGLRRRAAFSRGAESAEVGTTTRSRPGTTWVPPDRRTAVAGAGAARGRERARFIGAERAGRAGTLVDPVVAGDWEGAGAAGAAVGSACDARAGSRFSGSR